MSKSFLYPNSMAGFTSWHEIGHGIERICYLHPEDSSHCIKISPSHFNRQTLREISYFEYLERKGVPFSHLPHFYGVIEGKDFIGIEQELIQDYDQSSKRKGAITLPPPYQSDYLAVPFRI